MLAPGTAPRETVEGGRAGAPPRGRGSVDRRRGGSLRPAGDAARAREREHRRGQEVLV